ncbi:hypothetical protein VDG1235_4098 [Verrucomicrobiia bacterium DG1235]|nr:hypothetical protein VDG1235_4098 [Verrucomicrobiae bacterium DG1235]
MSVFERTVSLGRLGMLGACVLAGLDCGAAEVKMGGSTQLLVMGRDYGGDAKGESATVALTLEGRSQLSESVLVGGQLLHVQNLYENGKDDAGYWLSNDTTSVLNELYVDWDLERIGFGDTNVKIGRQTAGYDFFGTYKVRQKEQAFEGLVVKTKVRDGVSLDVGHIERYSTWSCREDGPSALTGEFRDLSERLGFDGGDKGVQFASASWERGDAMSFTVYDYFADSLYNNAGVKAAYSFGGERRDAFWTVSGHYIQQDGDSSGKMPGHDADSLELNLRYEKGGLTLDTGWTHISDGSSLLVPFRTSYVIDATLLWYTNQYEAGTDSLHLKAAHKMGKWTLVGVLVGAQHEDEREEQELDVVVKYAFENNVWVAFKGGYGRRDFAGDRREQEGTDLRLFVGYGF